MRVVRQGRASTPGGFASRRLACGHLVIRLHGVRRIHQRRAAAHIHRHAEHFFHLCPCRAEADKCFYMKADAAVATGGNANRQRDKFLGFFIQRAVFGGGGGQGGEGLHRIGNIRTQCFHIRGNALGDFFIIFVHGGPGGGISPDHRRYFDPKKFRSPNSTTIYQGVDGGIYANNPELIGVTGVYLLHPNFEIGEIVLLSLGTGDTIKNNQNTGNDGDIGWLKNKDIIGNMIDAESAIAETAVTAMLKNSNHFRFQLHLANELASMDNSSDTNLDALLAAAEDFIQQNTHSIDNLCKKLT